MEKSNLPRTHPFSISFEFHHRQKHGEISILQNHGGFDLPNMLAAAYSFPISSVKTLWKKTMSPSFFLTPKSRSFSFFSTKERVEKCPFSKSTMTNKFVFNLGCQNTFGEKDGDMAIYLYFFPSVSPKTSFIIFSKLKERSPFFAEEKEMSRLFLENNGALSIL